MADKADGVSIIMPAYRAEATIAAAVASVLGQRDADVALEIVIAADDGTDYGALLSGAGIVDPRIVITATPTPRSGASAARNAALDRASMPLAATLDADDLFAPGKLAATLQHVQTHGLVSTGLAIVDEDLAPLRTLGTGADKLLPPAAYKFTNLSMDSMIVWDRRRADPRYDPTLPCMTDLDFVMRLFATVPACYHVGQPLHLYRKLTRSISNGEGVAERMIGAKTRLRAGLVRGDFPLADPDGVAGLTRFLDISLAAERSFAPTGPGPHLFENHLEPMLRAENP